MLGAMSGCARRGAAKAKRSGRPAIATLPLLLAATSTASCGSGGSHPGDAGTEPPTTTGRAVGYQIDIAHSGHQPLNDLRPPLTRQWAVSLGEMASYPLIVDGRVFVTAKGLTGQETNLYALDVDTGTTLWGPVVIPGTYGWSAAAYEAGRVFVLSDTGYLGAFAATTGAVVWTIRVPDIDQAAYLFDSPPSAAGGTVFVSGTGIGGTVFAIAGDTGALRWKVPVTTGTNSSPAIGDEAIFVSSGCEEVSALDPRDGSEVWAVAGRCSGGGGTPVIEGERLWVIGPTFPQYETTNTVFNRRTGAPIRMFEADRSPAFADGHGYFVRGSALTKVDLATGAVVWTFEDDDGLRAPIVANGHVYVLSINGGRLHAIDIASGTAVWSDKASDWITAVSDTTGWVGYSLAADEHHLIVPAREQLIAYR
jgi:outer membrane protein assembly factor BamB